MIHFEGFIKLHRKIRKSSTYQPLNSKQRDIFIQCLLEASWEPKEECGLELEIGEFVASVRTFKKLCADDVTIQNIRTAWAKFVRDGALKKRIVKINNRPYTLLKVNNYDKYQLQKSTQQSTHKSTQQLTQSSGSQSIENKGKSIDEENKLTQQLTHKSTHKVAQPQPDSIVMQQDSAPKEVKEVKEIKEVVHYYSEKKDIAQKLIKLLTLKYPSIDLIAITKFVDKSANKAYGKYIHASDKEKMIESWFDVAVYEGKFEKYKVRRLIIESKKKPVSSGELMKEKLMKEIVKQIAPTG